MTANLGLVLGQNLVPDKSVSCWFDKVICWFAAAMLYFCHACQNRTYDADAPPGVRVPHAALGEQLPIVSDSVLALSLTAPRRPCRAEPAQLACSY
jgi:hypothetical protein